MAVGPMNKETALSGPKPAKGDTFKTASGDDSRIRKDNRTHPAGGKAQPGG